ncbi:heparin-binding hemagglutinin, partial [Nocardia sp. NPDC003345]
MTEKNTTAKPLFATVGATDAVYAAVVDAVTQVRERATDVNGRVDTARERFAGLPADVQTQFEQIRTRLSELPSELPEDLAELREKFTTEELRRLAEQYYRQVLDLYADLAVRGEETVDRLRTNHLVDEQVGRVESFYKDASVRAEEVLGRVNGLIGRPAKDETAAAPVVEAETPAAPDVLDAEVVEPAPVPAPTP